MKKTLNGLSLILSIIICTACSDLKSLTQPSSIEGKKIAFARDKGNCLACHVIADGEMPGNIGPPLKDLTTKYQNKQQLKDQIWDATQFNPETSMPPFGKNKILTDQEIDKIVDYLWTTNNKIIIYPSY